MKTRISTRTASRVAAATGIMGMGAAFPLMPALPAYAAAGQPARAASAPTRTFADTTSLGSAASPRPASTISTEAAADCGDGAYEVDRVPLLKHGGDERQIGEAILHYSPVCRKVRTVAYVYDSYPACADGGVCVQARVCHNHTGSSSTPGCHLHESDSVARAAFGSRKAVTGWVNDADICQYAKGYVYADTVPLTPVASTWDAVARCY